jgi:hypothetical protein
MHMTPAAIISRITSNLSGVVPKSSWGETSLFYNPGKKLPNGVYFCTIKENDGDNDTSSKLGRKDAYRLSIGVSKESYEREFGPRPKRPPKGGIVDTGHDFAALNTPMPHPIYAWMSWMCVLSPSAEVFEDLYPLIVEAHGSAIVKFNKKVR